MRVRWTVVLLFILSGLISLPLLVHSMPAALESAGRLPDLVPDSVSVSGVFEDNLLTNPSFEGTYRSDPPSSLLAEGWNSWFRETRPTDHRPEWNEEVLLGGGKVSWRVRHGNKAQKMFSSFSTHEGGIYQQVDVEPGRELEFSIWVQVWSSDCDKPCESPLEPGTVCDSPNTNGNYRASIGIDPTGGTDPLGSTVQWREYALRWDIPYDVWSRLSITATSQAEQVTVFTRGWAEFEVKHNDSYWEDAKLAYVTPTTPTPTVTSTSVPTMTVTSTPGPTQTPSPSPELTQSNYLPLISRNFATTPVTTATPTVTLTPTTTATATSVPPTVSPTTQPSCQDVVQNGEFEEEGGWTFQIEVPYLPGYTNDPVEDDGVLRLGMPPGGDNLESWSAAWQSVTLPATGSATLRFSYYPESSDLQRDYFEVRVLDRAGAPLQYLIHPVDGQSNDRNWLQHEFDLAEFRGRTIQIYFNVYNDGAAGGTRVYLDDVELEVCGATQQGIRPQAAPVQAPRFDLLQDVPFGQVHFTWVRYGKRTPNVDWTDCENPTDVEVEWIEAVNDGDAVDLTGWTLENSGGAVFTLPSFTLGAGEKLRIWTISRDSGPNDLFINRTEQMWDDTTGRATLRFPNGDLATGSICWDLPTGGFPIACPDETR